MEIQFRDNSPRWLVLLRNPWTPFIAAFAILLTSLSWWAVDSSDMPATDRLHGMASAPDHGSSTAADAAAEPSSASPASKSAAPQAMVESPRPSLPPEAGNQDLASSAAAMAKAVTSAALGPPESAADAPGQAAVAAAAAKATPHPAANPGDADPRPNLGRPDLQPKHIDDTTCLVVGGAAVGAGGAQGAAQSGERPAPP